MDRRFAFYRSSRWGGYRGRVRLFRSVRLNAIGWAAVVLVCLVGGGVGYGAGRAIAAPQLAGSLAGALGGLAVLVGVDRRRWGRLETGVFWGEDPDEVARIGAELQQRGLPVAAWTDVNGCRSLRYRNRDARRVRRALRGLGRHDLLR
ncbi:hypothetical protein [Plantactinospora sp. CA-290183]|uniref:hypothetical protein n=1 Tax=Plantactinospora sp. CA-290183 TaxID=3240006 RepID=UPI003D8F6927